MALAIGSLVPHVLVSRSLGVHISSWMFIFAKSSLVAVVVFVCLRLLPIWLGNSAAAVVLACGLTAILYLISISLVDPEFARRAKLIVSGKEAT